MDPKPSLRFRIALIPALGKTKSVVLAAIKKLLHPILYLSDDSVCLSPLLSTTGPTQYYTCSIHALRWRITANASRIRKSLSSLGYARLPAIGLGWVVLRTPFAISRSAFDLSTLASSLPTSEDTRSSPMGLPPPKKRRVGFAFGTKT